MDIKQQLKELRLKAGMTQKEFAKNLGIPIGTVRNWEQGIAAPADYMYEMISRIMEMDDMINWETIRLIDLMNKLCSLNTGRFIPFSEARPEQNPLRFPHDDNAIGIFYDDEEPIELSGAETFYRAIADCQVDEAHHNIISYWDDEYKDQFYIGVIIDKNFPEEPVFELRFKSEKGPLGDAIIALDPDGWAIY